MTKCYAIQKVLAMHLLAFKSAWRTQYILFQNLNINVLATILYVLCNFTNPLPACKLPMLEKFGVHNYDQVSIICMISSRL